LYYLTLLWHFFISDSQKRSIPLSVYDTAIWTNSFSSTQVTLKHRVSSTKPVAAVTGSEPRRKHPWTLVLH